MSSAPKIYLPPQRKKQQGMVLLVALVMTILFVLIGISIAEKSKTGTELASSNVRYNITFEAAEKSLHDAMRFIQNIRHGEPIASIDGSIGRSIAANFDLTKITEKGHALTTDPATSFIWTPNALENQVCPTTATPSTCLAGINFTEEIDNNMWQELAIQSSLDTSYQASNHDIDYLIKTYTFIQLMRKDGSAGMLGEGGNLSSNQNTSNYYLITVKASGYPPNTDWGAENVHEKARENVLVQAVYIQKY